MSQTWFHSMSTQSLQVEEPVHISVMDSLELYGSYKMEDPVSSHRRTCICISITSGSLKCS